MGAILPGDLGQALDDVRRRPDLGIPATEVDQRRPSAAAARATLARSCVKYCGGAGRVSPAWVAPGDLSAEDRVEDEVVQFAVVCPHDEAGPGLRLAAPEGSLPSMRRDREADLLIARRDEGTHVDRAPGSSSNRAEEANRSDG